LLAIPFVGVPFLIGMVKYSQHPQADACDALGGFLSPIGTVGHMSYGAGGSHGEPDFFLAILFIVAINVAVAFFGITMILAGLRVMRLRSHGLAIIASILAIVSPACLVGLPVGIWALVVLTRQDVRAAFGQKRRMKPALGATAGLSSSESVTGRQAARAIQAQVVDDAAIERARRQVKGPAIGLLVAGILACLTSPSVVVLVATFNLRMVSSESHAYKEGVVPPTAHDEFSILAAIAIILALSLVPVLLSSLMIYGAVKMKRLEAYGMAIAGSILAILSPSNLICFPIILPLGIWALVVLSQRDVRAAFGQEGRMMLARAPVAVTRKKKNIGRAAIILCLCVIPIAILVQAIAIGCGLPWARSQTMLATGVVVEIVALILGIIGWRSAAGKAAAIISGLLLLFLGPMFVIRTAEIHNRFGQSEPGSTSAQVVDVAQHPGGPWIAEFPRGTLELVAVTRNPPWGEVWWRPDGSPYTKHKFDDPGGKVGAENPSMELREFMFRGPTDASMIIGDDEPQGWYGDSGVPGECDGRPLDGYRSLTEGYFKSERTTNLHVAVAAGPWTAIVDSKSPTDSVGMHGCHVGDTIWSVTFPAAM
jgi:hypothetical protein